MEPANVVVMALERTESPVRGKEYVLKVAHADRAGVSQVARYRLAPPMLAALMRQNLALARSSSILRVPQYPIPARKPPTS